MDDYQLGMIWQAVVFKQLESMCDITEAIAAADLVVAAAKLTFPYAARPKIATYASPDYNPLWDAAGIPEPVDPGPRAVMTDGKFGGPIFNWEEVGGSTSE